MEIKKFIKEHKKEIIGTGVVIGVAAMASYLTKSYYTKNFTLVPKGLTVISWKPNEHFVTKEIVKEILDLNEVNDSIYAVVKNGSELSVVLLNNTNVITP